MKGLLRFILLKAIWMAIVVPLVLVVSGLVAFSIVWGIGRLMGKNVEHLGVCIFIPVAISLALYALLCMARAVRRFDERVAARRGVAVQTSGERGAREMTQSYGREHLK